MTYRSTLISIDQMFDELVSAGRNQTSAAIELQNALNESAIIVVFNGEPLRPEHRSGIGEMLRAFATDPKHAKVHFGWTTDIMLHGRALRIQFEDACGLSQPSNDATPHIPNRRFVSDEKLVAEGLEGIRDKKWPNVHKAATALAEQAEGASIDSKVHRLAGKMREALKIKNTLS